MGEPLFRASDVDPVGLSGRRRTKPVVVAVEGPCLTLGVELILASDITVAGAGSRFGQVEVQRAIMAYAGATLRMVSRFGWGDAMRYLLTGDMFDAGVALRLGLVQEVVPDRGAYAAALAIADRIAEAAPLAVRETLRNATLAVEQGWDAAVRDLVPTAKRLAATQDAQEGEAAFRARRAPIYRGS
jgi:enoyl-CoA hydratase